MNSKQRRKAYRAMPKAGSEIFWSRPSGRIGAGIVIGLVPAGKAEQFNAERAAVPSVNRIRVRMDGGAVSHPKISRIVRA